MTTKEYQTKSPLWIFLQYFCSFDEFLPALIHAKPPCRRFSPSLSDCRPRPAHHPYSPSQSVCRRQKQRATAQDVIRMQAFRGAFPACESGRKTRCQIPPSGKNCCAKERVALQ